MELVSQCFYVEHRSQLNVLTGDLFTHTHRQTSKQMVSQLAVWCFSRIFPSTVLSRWYHLTVSFCTILLVCSIESCIFFWVSDSIGHKQNCEQLKQCTHQPNSHPNGITSRFTFNPSATHKHKSAFCIGRMYFIHVYFHFVCVAWKCWWRWCYRVYIVGP